MGTSMGISRQAQSCSLDGFTEQRACTGLAVHPRANPSSSTIFRLCEPGASRSGSTASFRS